MPRPLIAIIPLVSLITLISISISIFGSESLMGSSQISLLISSAICVLLSMGLYHVSWEEFEKGIQKTIGSSAVAIMVLLLIGMLSASWMVSGIVPTLIYYGVQMMHPSYFLVATCIICAITSLVTGSSWTTIATIGLALLGIGNALGMPTTWTAGAIISGAYFGDKISPLSDTTILASSVADTDLFVHIRYMLFTTIPSFLITLVVFLIAGICIGREGEANVAEYTTHLKETFNISLWTLVTPILTGIMIAKKWPSAITLFISSLLAGITCLILQTPLVIGIAQAQEISALELLKGIILIFCSSTAIDTGSEAVNGLVATGGMVGMLNTIWLILCAMTFGGVMMASQMLQSITDCVLKIVKNTVSLVASTVGSGLLMNIATGDQYLSIIITSNMYKDSYKKMGLENRLLSRTCEDAVTVTSVLIPWNTCGLTQSTVLGVATLEYLPFCFFNYISPLMSIFVASLGWKIVKKSSK